MKSLSIFHRVSVTMVVIGAMVFAAGAVRAQSLGDVQSQLSGVEGKLSAARSDPTTAGEVINSLDRLEAQFAKVASSGKVDRSALGPTYNQLDDALSSMYSTWKKKKDDCIETIDNGGQCDYTEPEKLSLQALYPLSWLRFQGATTVYQSDSTMSKKLLNEAIDGFTESTLVIFEPNLVRENLLGRAYAERELGKFDKSEYDKAIADFKTIMEGGTQTEQYNPAKTGLGTTYMQMGEADKAAKYLGNTTGASGGGEMLQLQALFTAENATRDPAKKAAYHSQIVEKLKATEGDKEKWAVAVAAVSKYSQNVAQEFGAAPDPFEKWLCANVLLARKDQSGAAKYYVDAARGSAKYAKGYRYAADIFYNEKRYDQVEQLLTDVERAGGADAQWAAYMKYKLPRGQWESSGMKNTQLEDQWVKAATDYISKYGNGQYAPEMRFRLAERLQRQGNFLDAAKMYQQVSGSNEYSFTAKYNSAECDYQALATAGNNKNAPPVNMDQLRTQTIKDLRDTIQMEPAAERVAGSPAQKKFIHDTRGRAIYMLAGLLQGQKGSDPKEIASLLDGYEAQYPSMSDKFSDVQEWRITALDQLGRYDDVQRDVQAVVAAYNKKGATTNTDFIKELGLDFWHAAQDAQAKGNQKGYIANAKLTQTAYDYFEGQVLAGKTPAKNLTGTLSILGQAYIAQNDVDKAKTIFDQVVKADAASPDANAGLARIAQAKGDLKDAVTLWTNVESTAAESDPLWYEAKYQIAVIYAKQGNITGACSKLASTRAEHPTLGSNEMLTQWDALQKKICLKR
ncbi:MAG TPA: tetratricopeptide repeat protein [Candidatus Binataceae bacterium]|nr:tetratricopeptide repeat protein [Candidatus Binataceae bacterium]